MRYGSVLILSIILWGCQPYSSADLAGRWQATHLMEEGDSIAIDLSEVHFTFDEEGGYTFVSTLAYSEAGAYRLDGPYLFTTDTLHAPVEEKAVEIKQLANDSLILLMNDKGRDRVLTLRKE
jgi:hypothetical protein